MYFAAERINTPISTQELERRWKAVRKAMDAQGVDVLLMQNNDDHLGGYVKWFSDIPAMNGYPVSVIFPRDDDQMTIVEHGVTGSMEELPNGTNGLFRNVKRIYTATTFASVAYTLAYEAEAARKGLEPYAGGVVGMVGLGTLPVALMDYVRKAMPNTKFVDATHLVDAIKCIRSEEEIALARLTAALQDQAMREAFAAIKPGMKECEVVAAAERAVIAGGGEQGLYLSCSAPSGGPAGQGVPPIYRHMHNRTLNKGDVFYILIETNGPGGIYTELSRSCVLGKAPEELKEEFALVLESRQETLNRLKPGACCREIWDAQNAWRRAHDRPEESRLYCHAQGYDLVEPPLVKYDEPMAIQAGMNITCHPGWLSSRFFNSLTDNYLIGESGVVERFHNFPEIITEIE